MPLIAQLARYSNRWIDKVVLTENIPGCKLRHALPEELPLEYLLNEQQRGFGANHNAAFALCKSEWFLVLNPDIRLNTDTLGALLELAEPSTGLLAPRIYEPGGAQPEPHRALVTPWEILRRKRPEYVAPSHPAWVPGMFMLLRSSAYAQIGGFDNRYYMYGEDFDLCARLRLAGWQLQVAERWNVVHEAQRASHRNWKHLSWHFSSLAKVWLSKAFWSYRALEKRATTNKIGHCDPEDS